MNVLIRVDASIQMGTGHVMRCLALAQAIKSQGDRAHFAIASCPPMVFDRLTNEGFTIHFLDSVEPGGVRDVQGTIHLFQQLECQWICVDGYQFGAEYQQQLRTAGCRSLFLDDYGHASSYSADFVLNQNSSAHDGCYQSRHAETNLLLGTRYTLLRQEFLNWHRWQRYIPERIGSLLITLGGSDPENITTWILDALQAVDISDLTIVVIIGAANPHQDLLKVCAARSVHSVQIVSNVTSMPHYIVAADLAISAGGSTAWELALLGLPSLMVTLADNQVAIAESLQGQGISISLGTPSQLEVKQFASVIQQLDRSVEKRQQMSDRGRALMDADGCDRVLMAMAGDTLRLRSAKWQDCEQLWQWANEAETRQYSFQPAAISWESHVDWFQARLRDANCYFWIALDKQDQPIGQVRFDALSIDETQISLSIDRTHRHQGFGKTILNVAIHKIFRETAFRSISAWIKPDNRASISVFESVQFIKIESEYRGGEIALHYQLRKLVREELSE